jgi:hypothetical protein
VQRGVRLRARDGGELGVFRQHDPPGRPRLCTWKQASRILAGFPDDQATGGHTTGDPSLAGLRKAREQGWTPDSAVSSNGGRS